jgi:hypothetical protein
MEPIRPLVDRWLFSFLHTNTFRRRDFFERRNGTVRISSQVTSRLAETSSLWADAVGPVTEWVASAINRGFTDRIGSKGIEPRGIATPLTESNRSTGRDRYRKKDTKKTSRSTLSLRTCRECGKLFEKGNRPFCSKECWEKYNDQIVVKKLVEAGSRSISDMRSSGKDPAHGGEAAIKRGITITKRIREREDWERQNNGVDIDAEKERFKCEVLPLLRDVPLRRIVKATGLSIRYVSLIRRGQKVPHPMHYQKLEEMISMYNQLNGG